MVKLDGKCLWKSSAARGVYYPSCTPNGHMGIPPASDSPCPHCGKPVLKPGVRHRTASYADYQRWKAQR
jgi:hypothetical protein